MNIRIIEYDEVDSTNEEAKRLVKSATAVASEAEQSDAIAGDAKQSDAIAGEAKPGEASSLAGLYGSVVTARRQTAGKGRRGKSFFSTGGDSIYATFILPPLSCADPTSSPPEDFITVTAGRAVCEVIEKSTLYIPSIKGVNDVIVGGRKVCGILAEGVPGAVVLGIGVNINMEEKDFPEELREIAGSLIMKKEERSRFFDSLVETVFKHIRNTA